MHPNIDPDVLLDLLNAANTTRNEETRARLLALRRTLDHPVPFMSQSAGVFQVENPNAPGRMIDLGLEERERDRPPLALAGAHLALIDAGRVDKDGNPWPSTFSKDWALTPGGGEDDASADPYSDDIEGRARAALAKVLIDGRWPGAAQLGWRTLEQRLATCKPYSPRSTDNSVRNGLRRSVEYLERNGQLVIAHAVRQVIVTGGFLYAPRGANARLILT